MEFTTPSTSPFTSFTLVCELKRGLVSLTLSTQIMPSRQSSPSMSGSLSLKLFGLALMYCFTALVSADLRPL